MAGLAILALIGGSVAALVARSHSGQQPQYRTATVTRGDVVNTVTETGTLQPLTTVDIKSRAGGRVDVLAADVGSTVKTGQLIAKIDPTDTLTNLRTAQADLQASRAKVTQAQENMQLQQLQNDSQVQQAEQALQSAQAKLAQAEAQASAQPALTRSGISQAQAAYDAAVQELRQVQAATVPQTRASAQATYDDAKANLGSAQEALRQLQQATLPQEAAQARSAYDQANANLVVAKNDLARQKSLLAQGFIARSDEEASQNKYDLAVAEVSSAQKKMDTLQAEQSSTLQAARQKVVQAQAALSSAQRRMDTLGSELGGDVSTAQAKVAQAKAALDNARGNSVQDSLKQQDVDAARAAVRQAEAALAGARSNALQVQVKAGDIQAARADEASSSAKLQNANTQYQDTVITAPRDGVVLQKYVEQGTIITAGTSSVSQGTSIVQLGDVSRMFVDALVDETDIGSIKVGQPVEITVDAYPNRKFEGKVTRIDPAAQTVQNVTTINVTVEVENPTRELKPGLNASCDFIVGRAQNVLTVPNEAIKQGRRGGEIVMVLDHGKPAARRVQTGIAGSDVTEIRSGLNEGDTVITAFLNPTGQQGGSRAGGQGGGQGGGQHGGGFGGGRFGGGAMGGLPRGGGGR